MFRLGTRSILQKIKPINVSRVEPVNPVSLLTNQIRALSVTSQQERHLWLRKKKAFGQPYLKSHPRNRHYRFGTSLGDLQDIVRKHNDESWRHHAEQRRITRNMARRRKVTNDQQFISGLKFFEKTPKGMVLKSFTLKPTKPNSGNRKVCKVRLTNGAIRIAYIPFEQHNIVEHSRVLLYYHRKRDLIGCKLRVLRGVHDANFRPDRIRIRVQRYHSIIQDDIADWKSPPTPLKYNFNDY